MKNLPFRKGRLFCTRPLGTVTKGRKRMKNLPFRKGRLFCTRPQGTVTKGR